VDPTSVRVDTTITSSPTLFINIPGNGYSVSTTNTQMTNITNLDMNTYSIYNH